MGRSGNEIEAQQLTNKQSFIMLFSPRQRKGAINPCSSRQIQYLRTSWSHCFRQCFCHSPQILCSNERMVYSEAKSEHDWLERVNSHRSVWNKLPFYNRIYVHSLRNWLSVIVGLLRRLWRSGKQLWQLYPTF